MILTCSGDSATRIGVGPTAALLSWTQSVVCTRPNAKNRHCAKLLGNSQRNNTALALFHRALALVWWAATNLMYQGHRLVFIWIGLQKQVGSYVQKVPLWPRQW